MTGSQAACTGCKQSLKAVRLAGVTGFFDIKVVALELSFHGGDGDEAGEGITCQTGRASGRAEREVAGDGDSGEVGYWLRNRLK